MPDALNTAATTRKIAGWGNFPQTVAKVFEPDSEEALRQVVLGNEELLPRGNGRSYGDASLAPTVVSMLRMNRVLDFDPACGAMRCEAGALLADILRVTVPAGWFFKVTPGIKSVTVGGAIASDVHGKNHPDQGCFSNTVLEFDLLNSGGQTVRCSPSVPESPFWPTCGGMGWTGAVLRATIQLTRIPSALMRQRTAKAASFDHLMEIFAKNTQWPYAAAWVDCSSPKWRGAAFFAEHHVPPLPVKRFVFEEKKPLTVPFFAPHWLLNPWSIKAYNELYWQKKREGEHLVGLDDYFYPLDALQGWNKLYGRRGFVQYQCCIPENNAAKGLKQLLETVRACGQTPFLSVLKRHGDNPPQAVNAFPIKGYSLALDFPRTKGAADMVRRLDSVVWANGGKIYLTKDALSAPHMGRVNPRAFGDPKFSSLLRKRISMIDD